MPRPYPAGALEPAPDFDTRLIWAGLFLSLAVYAKAPVVDLWFSQRYWLPETGFFMSQLPAVQFSYRYTPSIGYGVLAVAAIIGFGAPAWARLLERWGRPSTAQAMRTVWRRCALAGLCAAALSNWVAVELMFKDHVGRPRPVQTVQFGGDSPFQGPFEIGPSPHRHRSFISGHSAAGFSLMGFGLAAGPVARRRWFLTGLLAGSLVGMGRILQGGHYLSDVVFAFYAVWISCELVALGLRKFDSRAPHRMP